jgi:hypothetical protein
VGQIFLIRWSGLIFKFSHLQGNFIAGVILKVLESEDYFHICGLLQMSHTVLQKTQPR